MGETPQRPATFEFITEGRVDGRRPMTSRWRNRYEITPTEQGCRFIHSLALLQVTNPRLRLRLPVLRYLAFKVGIPLASGRGLRNLVAMAEAREAIDPRAPGRLAS
jgi:hypothetical protein